MPIALAKSGDVSIAIAIDGNMQSLRTHFHDANDVMRSSLERFRDIVERQFGHSFSCWAHVMTARYGITVLSSTSRLSVELEIASAI